MPTNNEVIYAAHVENLKYIQYSIDEIFTLAKLKIKCKQENTDNFKSIIRLLILQLGIWSEARYNKLICEYKYNSSTKDKIFTELELNLLNLNKEKIKQWNTIVELSFRKHYNIYIGYELSAVNLGQDKFDKYINIVDIIKIHLQSIIEIRNKLAHGHWINQLTPNAQQINNINITSIDSENILTLEKKYQILKYLSQILHDLIISQSTFDRDFDKYYKEIIDRKIFLDKHATLKYQQLVTKLQK